MEQPTDSGVPMPRSGVMPARRQDPESPTRGVAEPATQYAAGHAPNVVRGETNYLVNPDHPDFGAIRTGPISRFQYDPRLAR
ncbi:MAG: hypothetical protein OXP69_20315 [Spirochaetaceae bacterium]|nr:hypothetical protein [Spirochaetaceae bacterium]